MGLRIKGAEGDVQGATHEAGAVKTELETRAGKLSEPSSRLWLLARASDLDLT